jgi:hypothetical protein
VRVENPERHCAHFLRERAVANAWMLCPRGGTCQHGGLWLESEPREVQVKTAVARARRLGMQQVETKRSHLTSGMMR